MWGFGFHVRILDCGFQISGCGMDKIAAGSRRSEGERVRRLEGEKLRKIEQWVYSIGYSAKCIG